VPGRIEGQGRRGKQLTADYVLEYRNTKLAVVEAKAWDEELTEGVAQAKYYVSKLAIRFTYSTNGQGIYGIDMETGKKARRRAILRRANSGAGRLPSRMRGATALPPCPRQTRAVHG